MIPDARDLHRGITASVRKLLETARGYAARARFNTCSIAGTAFRAWTSAMPRKANPVAIVPPTTARAA